MKKKLLAIILTIAMMTTVAVAFAGCDLLIPPTQPSGFTLSVLGGNVLFDSQQEMNDWEGDCEDLPCTKQLEAGEKAFVVLWSSFPPAYVFNGWFEGNTLIAREASFYFTMPNRAVTLRPVWTSTCSITDCFPYICTCSDIQEANGHFFRLDFGGSLANFPRGEFRNEGQCCCKSSQVIVFTSREQLQEFFYGVHSTTLSGSEWIRSETFTDTINSFGDDFFENQNLVAFVTAAGNTANYFILDGVTYNDNTLSIILKQHHGAGGNAMTDWLAIIEVPVLSADIEIKINNRNWQVNYPREYFELTVQGGYIFTCEKEFNAWNWADMPVARPPSSVQVQVGQQVFIISTMHPPGGFFYAWLEGNNHITTQRDFAFTMPNRDVVLTQRVGNSKDMIGQFKAWAIEDYSAKHSHNEVDIAYFYGHLLRQIAPFHTDISIAIMFNSPSDAVLGSEEIITAQRRITVEYTCATRILVWRMGRFYRLQEAYNAGYLTANNILEIRRLHHARLNMHDEMWSLWGDMQSALISEGFTITLVHTIFTGGGGFRAERDEDEFLNITVHIIDQSHPPEGWFFTTTDHGMNYPMFIFAIQQFDIFFPSSISAFGTDEALRIAHTAIGGTTAFPSANSMQDWLNIMFGALTNAGFVVNEVCSGVTGMWAFVANSEDDGLALDITVNIGCDGATEIPSVWYFHNIDFCLGGYRTEFFFGNIHVLGCPSAVQIAYIALGGNTHFPLDNHFN